jgi:predicted NBD/HSP70 family sugar kinase
LPEVDVVRPAVEPATQRAVRRHNLGIVLRHLADHGPRSRATIALETGFNKSTVSSLVGELMDLGLLLERGTPRTGAVGRPGAVVDVAREGVIALGLEVNVDYLAVQATDLTGGSRHRSMEAAGNRDQPAEAVLGRLAALAGAALEAVAQRGLDPIGATIALPGLVEAERGTLLVAPNLGWADVPVAGLMREHLGDGLPIACDNEANLGALAELWDGAGIGLRDFMYLSGEIGIGSGLVIGGELHRGHRGFGGEFGHTTVAPDGPPCACGSRGCLETLAGLDPLMAAAGLGEEAVRSTSFGRPVAELIRRARSRDEASLAALRDAGRWLGVALGSAVNLLSPQAIVLGGFFAPLTEWLRPAIEEELRVRVLGSRWSVPRVVPSTLGPEAAVRGAAALSLDRVFADPGSVGELLPG